MTEDVINTMMTPNSNELYFLITIPLVDLLFCFGIPTLSFDDTIRISSIQKKVYKSNVSNQ